MHESSTLTFIMEGEISLGQSEGKSGSPPLSVMLRSNNQRVNDSRGGSMSVHARAGQREDGEGGEKREEERRKRRGTTARTDTGKGRFHAISEMNENTIKKIKVVQDRKGNECENVNM